MDALKNVMQKAAPVDEALRRPLVPSEKNNVPPASRRRDVASRYKSGVPTQSGLAAPTPRVVRCTSPSPGRTSAVDDTPLLKRAQSAERKRSSRPSTPSSSVSTFSNPVIRSTTPVRNAITELHSTSRHVISARAPDGGLWPSMRNLSSSFQSEFVAAPINKKDKTKLQAGALAERKRSPLRRKNIGEQRENAQPLEDPPKRTIEQHRWPTMMSGRVSGNIVSKTINLADKASRSISLSNPSRVISPRRIPASQGTCKGLNQSSNDMARRLAIDARRTDDNASFGRDVSSQTSERSKSVSHPSRTLSSPVPVIHRPSSPSKVSSGASSTCIALQSLSRARPSTICRLQSATTGLSGGTSRVISYIVDARKGKNTSQIENIHQLRLLYNRYLQWHFANARAEDTLSFQKTNVESILYTVWKDTLKLRDAVAVRRIDLQDLQQQLKLYRILKEQIAYLNQWLTLEKENSGSLVGAMEALTASTLRLPVTSGARADTVDVKNAISSAIDIMQAMGSSICYLLSKVEDRTSLVTELSVIAGQEKVMLDECRELLATAATLQYQQMGLRLFKACKENQDKKGKVVHRIWATFAHPLTCGKRSMARVNITPKKRVAPPRERATSRRRTGVQRTDTSHATERQREGLY